MSKLREHLEEQSFAGIKAMKMRHKRERQRTPDQLKAMALMDKVRDKIAKGARYNDVSADITNAIKLLKKGDKK